jgi:hypothetical protein
METAPQLCAECGGSGKTYITDPVVPRQPRPAAAHTRPKPKKRRARTSSASPAAKAEKTPEERDANFATLLAFALLCFLVYADFKQPIDAAWWGHALFVLIPPWILHWFLMRAKSVTRLLRYSFIACIVLGAIWLLVNLIEDDAGTPTPEPTAAPSNEGASRR